MLYQEVEEMANNPYVFFVLAGYLPFRKYGTGLNRNVLYLNNCCIILSGFIRGTHERSRVP